MMVHSAIDLYAEILAPRRIVMSQQIGLNHERAAVLIMDFQNDIVNQHASYPNEVVQNAAKVLHGARQNEIPVIYLVHRGGRFAADNPGTQIHPGVLPESGDIVLTKTKGGAFSTTGLDILLRELGKDTLIVMGIATSGCVLSTTRWATDINYKVLVVTDACDDSDREVHRVLTQKIFVRHGILTTEEFLGTLL